MFCGKCGKEIKGGSKFCPYCGSPCTGADQPPPPVESNFMADLLDSPQEPSNPGKQKSDRKRPNVALICAIAAVILAVAGIGGVLFVRSSNGAKLKDVAASSVIKKQMAQIQEIYNDYFDAEDYRINTKEEDSDLKSAGPDSYTLTVPAQAVSRADSSTWQIVITAQVDTNFLRTEYSIFDMKLDCELPYTVEYEDFVGLFTPENPSDAGFRIALSGSDLVYHRSAGMPQYFMEGTWPELTRNHLEFVEDGQLVVLKYVPAAFSTYGADTIYQTTDENGAPAAYIRADSDSGISGVPSSDSSENVSGNAQLDYSWVEGTYLQSGSSSTVLSLQFDSWNPWESEDRWYVRFAFTEGGFLTGSGTAYYSGGDNLPRLDGQLIYSDSPITLKYDGSGFNVTCAELNLYEAAFYPGAPADTPAYTNSADYVIPDSSWRILTDADVAGLTVQEVNYAKNEIYARHGRLFVSEELQAYFDSKSWYFGTVEPENFTEGMLSEIEKENVTFLSGVENSLKGNN